MVYYPDSELSGMSADQKKEAKEQLEDEGYKQGINFGKNMTKAEAEELAKEDLADQFDDADNKYTLTENSVGKNKNVIMDPTYAKGVSFTLKKENSWKQDKDGNWPDMLAEHPTQYSKAYETNITNKYKKATIKVKKKAGNTADGKAHGDATLEGAVFQLYSDAACTNKATVYDKSGNAKTAGEYKTTADGTLTTDYLRSGNTYYIKELSAPKGFIVNGTPQSVTIDASSKDQEFSDVLMEKEIPNNEIKGKIAINKNSYDPTGKITEAEKNVTFQVYLKSKGSYDKCADDERDTIKTNDKGYAETMVLVGGLLWMILSFSAYNRMDHNRMPGNEFGSAKWGEVRDFNEKYAAKDTGKISELSAENKVLSQNVRFRYDSDTLRNNNVFVVGGSGAGKTAFFLTPNLMSLADM